MADFDQDELVRQELARAEAKRRKGRWRLGGVGLAIVVIGVVFAYVLPKIADYGEVWGIVTSLSWEWLLALVGVTMLNIATIASPLMAGLPGLGYLNALRVGLASSALGLVAPGGAAVGMATQFGMLKRWGFEGRPVGLAVSVTSIWNQLFVLGSPIVAIAALTAEGGRNSTLEWVALIGLIVFAVIVAGFSIGLSSSRLAKKVGDSASRAASWAKAVIHKQPVRWTGDEFVAFRAETIGLLSRRWHYLTLATLSNQLSVFVVLVVSLRAVGVPRADVSIVEAFAAWTLIRALGTIPITPGGFGVEELALTAALVGFGTDNAKAVAATLIYRFLTVVPALALGLLSGATFKLGPPRPAAPQAVP